MKSIFTRMIGPALLFGIVAFFSSSALAQKDKGMDFSLGASAAVGEDTSTEGQGAQEPSAEKNDSSETGSYVDDEMPDKKAAEAEKTESGSDVKPKILQGTWTEKIIFSSDDGLFSFRPIAWLKPRFGLLITPDKKDEIEGSGFTLKDASLGFEARMFKLLVLYLEANFNKGAGNLEDYYADLDPFGGKAVLRVGSFRPWYCRQLLITPTKLQIIENAQAWEDGKLGLDLGRDLGASIFGMVANGFEYGLGVWNGERFFGLEDDPDMPGPGNIDFMVGGRLAVHPLALAGVGDPLPIDDESDVKISEKPALVLGAAAYYNKRHNLTVEVPGDTDPQNYYDNQLKVGAEHAAQWKGASFQSEFFLLYNKVLDKTDQPIKAAVTAADKSGLAALEGVGFGVYAQAGYFVLPRQLEIAARFDTVDEDTDLRGQRFYPGLGATYYIHGHNLKAQFLYRLGVGAGYEKSDLGYMSTTHGIYLMLQAAI